jgi:hypothetical protein
MHAWCDPGPGIKLAGQALNMTAVTMMPKNRRDWYNSVGAGGFLLQNLETRIHMFWAGVRRFAAVAVDQSDVF